MNQKFMKLSDGSYVVSDGNLKIVNSDLSTYAFGDVLFMENEIERLERENQTLNKRIATINYNEKWRKILDILVCIALGIGTIVFICASIPLVVYSIIPILYLMGKMMSIQMSGTKRGNNKKRKFIEFQLENIENEIEILKKKLEIGKQNVEFEEINPKISIDQQAQDYNVGPILEVNTVERHKIKILNYTQNKNDLPK